MVTDNARNMTNAISLIDEKTDIHGVTCAAHTIQFAINKALKEENVECLIRLCSKVVGHFKHSNVAKQVLESQQQLLKVTKTALLQCCSTRWNSTFFMLERLCTNRCCISNVIADRSVTSSGAAKSLEITESQWGKIESLIIILKPLQIITTLFCGETHSPISMVRPLLKNLLEKHLNLQESDDEIIYTFMQTISSDITRRCKLEFNESSIISFNHICCFLDPRYKDLEHEPLHVRDIIRVEVKKLHEALPQQTLHRTEQKSYKKTALQFIYNDEIDENSDLNLKFETSLAEPPLFDLCPFECGRRGQSNMQQLRISQLNIWQYRQHRIVLSGVFQLLEIL